MILKRTNIEDKLRQVRKKGVDSDSLIQEVHAILTKDTEHVERIDGNLAKRTTTEVNNFNFDFLETKNIYHLEQIKKICIDYRLRFLDTHYFKGEIPVEAIQKIKKMEREHGLELQGFKIIAPSRLFRLKDKDDPLLFAPIGNGYFYLIHKWGNDLHPLRKIFAWPFKDILNLVIMVLFGSYLITMLIPENLFSRNNDSSEFWIIYFFMFKSCAAIVLFYGFALGKNFNPGIWNSKYFNT